MKRVLSFILALVLLFGMQSSVVMAADTTGPVVKMSYPANASNNFGKFSHITIQFSEMIQKGNTFGSIKLTDSKGAKYELWSPDIERNMIVIEPRKKPEYGTECTLTIPAGAVRDLAGNPLQKAFILKYKVEYYTVYKAGIEAGCSPYEGGGQTLTENDVKRLKPVWDKKNDQDSLLDKNSKLMDNDEFLKKYGNTAQGYIDTAKRYMQWRENIDYRKLASNKDKDEYRKGYLENSDDPSEANFIIENAVANKLVKKSVFMTNSSCIYMDSNGDVRVRGIEYFTFLNKNSDYKKDIKTGMEYKRDVELLFTAASQPSAANRKYLVGLLLNLNVNPGGPSFIVSPNGGTVAPGDVILVTAVDPDGILDIKYSWSCQNYDDTKFLTESITIIVPNNPGRQRLTISGQDYKFAGGEPLYIDYTIADPEAALKEENTKVQTMSGVKSISAGDFHTVVLKENGTLVAWGGNENGECTALKGLSGVKDATVFEGHSAIIKEDGTLVITGIDPNSDYAVPAGLKNVKAVAAGSMYYAALKEDGTVVTWGSRLIKKIFKVPDGLSGVKAIAAVDSITVALKEDGSVVFWGDNTNGAYNIPSGLSGVKAIEVKDKTIAAIKEDGTVAAWGEDAGKIPKGLSGIKSISIGSDHSVGLKENGEVVAWGDNMKGQCDIPAGLSNVKSVAAGVGFSAAIKEDGTLVVWGANSGPASFVPKDGLKSTGVSGGESHTLVLKEDGTVKTWGSNSYGLQMLPKGLKNVKAVAAGWGFSLALKNDGTVTAWGDNRGGECNVPKGLANVKAIAAGMHSAVLKADGTVVTWGINGHKPPNGLKNVKAIAAGLGHTAALKQDGTVVVWGNNYYKQCNVPKGLSKVKAIAAGYNHMVALKEDGTVAAWGDNGRGQCNVPKGLSGVVAIAAGEDLNVALKKDGTIVTWGSREISYVPEWLSGLKVKEVTCGRSSVTLLLDDGAVAGWDGSWGLGSYYMP